MSSRGGFTVRPFVRRWWPAGLGLGTGIGLLNFTYKYLDDVARGVHTPMREPFVEELSAAYGVVALLPFVIWMALRFPLDRKGRLGRLTAHLMAIVVFSILHTLWNWGTRTLLFPLVSLGSYDYGAMPARFFMEFPSDVIVYSLVLILTYLVQHYRRAQEQRVALSDVQSRLARARLENLRTQLHPHFLFNALNVISSVMYDDPEAADTMISKLSELLRRAIEDATAEEVPLAEEIETLELYLDLMQARFGDRLEVEVEVSDEARAAIVPALILQPLVENALRHGSPDPPELARVEITGERDGSMLRVTVTDNGPGFADPDSALMGKGIGLSNTAARLRQLYGERARLGVENRPRGGASVSVILPFAPAGEPLAAPVGAAQT